MPKKKNEDLTGDKVIARLDEATFGSGDRELVHEQVAREMWLLVDSGKKKGRIICKEILTTLKNKAPGYHIALKAAINRDYMGRIKWSLDPETVMTCSAGLKKQLLKVTPAAKVETEGNWAVNVTYEIVCSHVFDVKAKNAKEAVAKAEQACHDTDMYSHMSTGGITETVILRRPDDVKFKNPSGQVRSK